MKNIKITIDGKEIELSEETTNEIMNKLKEEKKEFPQVGDRYFYIDADGEVDTLIYEENDENDNYRKDIGNMYEIEEDAIRRKNKQYEKLKAIVRVKNYIKDNFGYDPEDWADWEGGDEIKHYIIYKYGKVGMSLSYSYYSNAKPNSFIGYIKTDDECKILIKNCKDDLEIICK